MLEQLNGTIILEVGIAIGVIWQQEEKGTNWMAVQFTRYSIPSTREFPTKDQAFDFVTEGF